MKLTNKKNNHPSPDGLSLRVTYMTPYQYRKSNS